MAGPRSAPPACWVGVLAQLSRSGKAYAGRIVLAGRCHDSWGAQTGYREARVAGATH